MAKRERDGWRVGRRTVDRFSIEHKSGDYAHVFEANGKVHMHVKIGGIVSLPPARAAQFAAKVAAIAARAAKEAKDGR